MATRLGRGEEANASSQSAAASQEALMAAVERAVEECEEAVHGAGVLAEQIVKGGGDETRRQASRLEGIVRKSDEEKGELRAVLQVCRQR